MTVKVGLDLPLSRLPRRNFRVVPMPNFHKHHINQYVNWITQPTLLRASARQAHLPTLKLQEVRDDGERQLYVKNRHSEEAVRLT
jgi:hypothetical protein